MGTICDSATGTKVKTAAHELAGNKEKIQGYLDTAFDQVDFDKNGTVNAQELTPKINEIIKKIKPDKNVSEDQVKSACAKLGDEKGNVTKQQFRTKGTDIIMQLLAKV